MVAVSISAALLNAELSSIEVDGSNDFSQATLARTIIPAIRAVVTCFIFIRL
jgi:hypothetical protein